MTKNEINLMYNELDKLLKDICKFLNEEIDNGSLSNGESKNTATNLIKRSKKQLQVISTISLNNDSLNEPYVDMQGSKVNQENVEQEVYSDVSLTFEGISNSSTLNEENSVCPYSNLSVTDIKEGKRGHLYRKEKLFIFEQQKKIFAAVYRCWFLIYINDSSSKPCQNYDLTKYQAKPTATQSKDVKKRDDSFDLINLITGKSHHFVALTRKDMLQWITAINSNSRSLPPLPDYELNEMDSDYSNDYEPLKEYQLTRNESVTDRIETVAPAAIPLPPPRNTKPINRNIRKLPSKESLSNEYDCVGYSNTNSFDDDPEDIHYDHPSSDLNKAEYCNENDEEEEIYDVLQCPSPETESEIRQINFSNKLKIGKSKVLGFGNRRKK